MERIYNIPLRKEFQKAPKYKRAKRAITAIKEFLSKHMKAKEVKIGKYLNQEIWKNGPRNPPHKVNVKAIKEEEIVKVELTTAPIEEEATKKKEEKKTQKETKEETPKKEEVKKEEPKEKGTKAEEKIEKKESDSKEEEKKPAAKKKTTKKKTEKVPTAAELKEKKSSKKE